MGGPPEPVLGPAIGRTRGRTMTMLLIHVRQSLIVLVLYKTEVTLTH